MVVAIKPNFIQIIVFPTHSNALLTVYDPFERRFHLSRQKMFELETDDTVEVKMNDTELK